MSEQEAGLRRCISAVMCSPNAADVRAAESMTHHLDALLEEHRKKVEQLRTLVDGLASEMERTLHHREQKGGMSVPDHGDFASVPPSTLGRLQWWAREMRVVLAGRSSGLLVRAKNEGLERAAHEAEVSGFNVLAETIRAMMTQETP